MIKEKDLKWHIKRVNNIETNPIDSEYCIVDQGGGTGRMYRIQPMYPADYTGLRNQKNGYKYFIFFECSVRKATDEELLKYKPIHYSCYLILSESLIQVYDTMEDAKKRAYEQYKHIYGYVLSHVVDDTEESTKCHFIV